MRGQRAAGQKVVDLYDDVVTDGLELLRGYDGDGGEAIKLRLPEGLPRVYGTMQIHAWRWVPRRSAP